MAPASARSKVESTSEGSRFIGNRVNVTGHIPNAPGGAIFVTQSTLHITTSSFEGNQAGYVGGAIYALGDWQDPVSVPSVDLEISNSSFTNNSAARDASVGFGSPTVGGAIHVEDQATLKLYNCRFTNNSARQGGAISNFRAVTEIEGCVFSGNRAIGTGSAEGIGGTIIGLSRLTASMRARRLAQSIGGPCNWTYVIHFFAARAAV